MRFFVVGFLYLFLFLFFIACTKPDSDENSEPGNDVVCVDSEFTTILNANINPACIIEDSKSNILVYGEFGNKIHVTKVDPKGEILWAKEFLSMYGKPMNIIETEDGGYIIVSGRMHFESAWGNQLNSATVQEGFELDSNNNYQPYFVNKTDYTPEYKTSLDRKIYITKMNENGDILNQASEGGNFTPGQIIQPLGNDEYLITVFGFWGDGAYIENPLNPFYFTFPRDKNSVYFLKMNGDGNIWFSIILKYALVFETIEEILERKIEFCLAINGDQYVLNLPNETYLTDHYGFEQAKFQPKFNFTGNHTFSMTKADINSNYFIGRTDFYNASSEYYLLKAEMEGSVVWSKELDPFEDARLGPAEDGFIACISGTDSNIILKYNSVGEIQWQFEPDTKPDIFLSTCSGALVIANYLSFQERMVLVKTVVE